MKKTVLFGVLLISLHGHAQLGGFFKKVSNAVKPAATTESTCLPTAVMSDPELEAGILKAFKAQGFKEEGKVVRIVSDHWTIVRHDVTGAVIGRKVLAWVGATLKDKCIKEDFEFMQDHDGESFQKDFRMTSVVGHQDKIKCECLQETPPASDKKDGKN